MKAGCGAQGGTVVVAENQGVCAWDRNDDLRLIFDEPSRIFNLDAKTATKSSKSITDREKGCDEALRDHTGGGKVKVVSI